MVTEFRLCASMVLAALLAQIVPLPVALRALLSVPIVLVMPGYLICRCMQLRPLPWVETSVISIALSMSCAAMTGLVLHVVGGLSQAGWTVALGAICGIALMYLRQAPRLPPFEIPAFRPVTAIATAAGLVLAIAGLEINRYGHMNHKEFAYTELWLTPTHAGSQRFALGVRNKEHGPEHYALEIRLDGKVVAHWADFFLNDGERLVTEIDLPVKLPLTAEKRAEALLFKKSAPGQIYRKVWASFMPATPAPYPKAEPAFLVSREPMEFSRKKEAP